MEKHSFKFGDFLLDAKEKILLRNGKPLPITPKAFQLLLILLENRGHLLEKDALIKAMWADSFVEEVNLAFTVSVLRKVLGDDKQKPIFIETISRRGYRFIAEVSEINDENHLNNGNKQAVSDPQKLTANDSPGFKKFLIPVFAILVIGLVSLGFWSARRQNTESTAPILSAPFEAEKFSTSGKVRHAAISPDGKLVAFINEVSGKQVVWLRKLESSENVQIVQPSEEFYHGIVFSHDGQTIFFVRTLIQQQPRSGIYRVSIFGGIPQKILESVEGWMSISPDDKQISYVRCQYKDDDYCSLMIADADGRNERKLVTRPHPVRLGDNQFSPDGKSIAFASGNSANGGNDFRLLKFDLASGAETEISEQKFFNIKSLKWLPDGNNLLVAALEQLDGKAGIRQVSISTGKTEQLTNDATNYVGISLNKDASRMVSVLSANNHQLHLTTDGTTKTIIPAREAIFAPDGKIIFSSDDNDIWTIGRDGRDQHQLTNNPAKDFIPLPSPDGQFIYFTSNRTGANQIWRMNMDGSNQIQITKNEGGYPRFVTEDGKWIYYESGFHHTLWKVSADGTEESAVLEIKLYRPAISPDGKMVAFFFRDKEKNNQSKIVVVTLADKKTLKVLEFTEAKSLPVKIAWSKDNKTINYVTFYNSKNSLWTQSLNEEKPRLNADLGDKDIEDFSLAADGNSFIYTRGEWLHDAILLKGLK